jgi:protein O-mannosyl-transferase
MADASPPTHARWSAWWPLLVLLLVTAATYSPLWDVAFSWDDEALIVDNQVTGDLANWKQFFTRDLWSTTRLSELKSGYYRPLMLLSLALDRALFGLSATAAHVHSLMWHLGAVAALYGVLLRLAVPATALAGATLFALHPVQSEVLALVAARNDSMAAVAVLGALWLLMPRTSHPGRLVAAGLLALGGLLSKESALLAPAMLLALDLARFKRPGHWARYATLIGAVGVYFGLRQLADLDHAIVPAAGAWELVGRNALGLIGVYGDVLVWPWPLTPARHISYMPPLGETLMGLLILLGLLTAAIVRGERRALVLAGLAWAALAWVPSLAATLDKGLLGERYLYLPLAGLALAWVGAMPRLPRWVAPALAVPCIVALQLRLPDWENSRTVWDKAHAAAPTAFTAGGLAWYYHRDKDFETANRLFLMALEGDPPYRDVCDMVVMSLLEARQDTRAVEVGQWALAERGCDPAGLITHHLAIALAGTGHWTEGVKVAVGRPGGPEGPAIIVIAGNEARKGNLALVYEAARRRAPKDPGLLDRTARLLRLSGDPEVAAAVLALKKGPPAAAPAPAPGPPPAPPSPSKP